MEMNGLTAGRCKGSLATCVYETVVKMLRRMMSASVGFAIKLIAGNVYHGWLSVPTVEKCVVLAVMRVIHHVNSARLSAAEIVPWVVTIVVG